MLPRKLVSTQGQNVQGRKLVKFCEKDTKLSYDKIAGRHVHSKLNYSPLPITRTFKGNRKKVRVIGSSSYREFEENSRD